VNGEDGSLLLETFFVESIFRLSSDLLLPKPIFSDCVFLISLTHTHTCFSVLSFFLFSLDRIRFLLILYFLRRQIDALGLVMDDTILFVFDAFAHFSIGDQLHRVRWYYFKSNKE
jgi:hypothetical protein